MAYTPYTYLIGWSKHNKYYYGVRFAKTCHPSDLWKTYFTSSKHVTNFRVQYGEPDIVSIRKIFDTKQQACLWEHKVLTRLNVIKNPKFLNQTNNKCWDISPERYKQMGIAKKGKPMPLDHRKKVSASYTPDRRKRSRKLFQLTSYFKIYEITFPDQHVEIVNNIVDFCKLHNLSRTSISTLANGKWVSDTYKGYKAKIIGTASKPRSHQATQ